IEAGTAARHGADMAGADVVAVEKIADIAGIAVFAQPGEIIHRPIGAEQSAHIPGGVERIAGIAEAILAILAAAHFDHAFTDADEALLNQNSCPPRLSAGLCR